MNLDLERVSEQRIDPRDSRGANESAPVDLGLSVRMKVSLIKITLT
jgi:hypothetical protein